MAKRIDGKAVAAEVRREVHRDVQRWIASGRRAPYLAVILVGDDPASASYVRSKIKASRGAAIEGDTIRLAANISESALLGHVARLNADDEVDGILVQLPLPRHIDARLVLETVDPDKDVDGLHVINAGRLATAQAGLVPCTPAGIMELLRRSDIAIEGRRAVVIGRSNLVGKPLAHLLLGANATVTVCHSRTRDLGGVSRQADILVAAIGRAQFVGADMIKPGAAVIDVGINRLDDTSRPRGYRLVGDVDFDAAQQVAGAITPVPGGVGPMTVAMLLRNTLRAARRR